ncbi:NUDIX hydrolase [Candidatus Uhrbacteria bacterium]|nr:NUDIX hydrolase [Candidatus Uhrbacteria bacterium]
MAWKKLSSKEVYRNKWMWVTEDKIQTDSGQELTFGVTRKLPFALVIPWDGTHFTLVGEYRYFVSSFSWAFPQGHYLGDLESTARQELKEEIGLGAKKIKEIGSFWIGPGAIDQECHVFLATELAAGPSRREASEEDMQVKKVTVEEFKSMISQGVIKDGPSIAAFYFFMGNV